MDLWWAGGEERLDKHTCGHGGGVRGLSLRCPLVWGQLGWLSLHTVTRVCGASSTSRSERQPVPLSISLPWAVPFLCS